MGGVRPVRGRLRIKTILRGCLTKRRRGKKAMRKKRGNISLKMRRGRLERRGRPVRGRPRIKTIVRGC